MSRLFAIALISLAIAPARPAEIAVKGKVVDETETPIAGVRVRLSPHGTPEAVSSDADGEFEVKVPAFGHYFVQAAHEHFFPLRDHPVEIVDQRELVIVLNHQQERPSVLHREMLSSFRMELSNRHETRFRARRMPTCVP